LPVVPNNWFSFFKKEFAAKEKLEIVKEHGEPSCGRAAKSGRLGFATEGGEIRSNYFQHSAS